MTRTKRIWRPLTIVFTIALLQGNVRLSAENWVTVNKPIPGMPQIIQSMRRAKGNVVKLNTNQRNDVLSALVGPVKETFTRDYLTADIWAAWSGPASDQETYMIRLSADRERYAYIGVNTSGILMESGNGRVSGGKISDLNFPIEKLKGS